MFGNPMIGGHSGWNRFPGLSTMSHRARVNRNGILSLLPVNDNIRGDIAGFVAPKKNIGKRYKMARRSYKRRNKRRGRKIYRRKRRTVQPFQIVRTMKSVVAFAIDPAGAGALGAIGTPWLKLNSGYDPTGILGSGQPLGYDQYTALYKRAAVAKWSCKIEICTVDNTTPICVGFTPTISSTALTNYNHYKELPGTVSSIVTPDVDKLTMFARGGVKKYFMPKSGRMLSDDQCTHAIGSDPTNLLYGHIWAQPMDQSSDAGIIRGVITIWQTVIFYQPEVPARS